MQQAEAFISGKSPPAPAVCPGAVAIVASAGGIPALIQVLAGLNRPFAPPLMIAQHLSRSAPSVLPSVLNRHTGCLAKWAEQGEKPASGYVYVIPPACALVMRDGRFGIIRLADDARSWLRVPDLLLNSLAETYGAKAIAVVLSGVLPAGVTGLRAIRRAGGIVIAQNQLSSDHFEMPQAAIDLGKAEIIFPPDRIAHALNIMAESERSWVFGW